MPENKVKQRSSLIQRCLCRCAVRAVSQELVKSHRKENRSAAMTVFHVQREKSATAQVQLS